MLGTGIIDKPGVFYTNDHYAIFNREWLLDSNKIHSLKQHNLSVIDLSSEHYGQDGIDHVYHALESAGLNFLLLSHEPLDHLKFDRMLFYPHWYHWARENFIIPSDSHVKKYKWCCLNGNPRAHRVYNYFYSRQQPYYDSACFTFFNDNVYRPDDVELSDDVKNFWNNIKTTLPNRSEIFQFPRADSLCNLPAIYHSYVHLVTETTVAPRIFLSEKTWKPIAAGQIFLVFGNPGIVSYLRDQGVDVFDDLIDHSYDFVEDWQHRLHLIHQQLKQLIEKNLEDIYVATRARRYANTENFFSGAFDKQYQHTITQCINMLS